MWAKFQSLYSGYQNKSFVSGCYLGQEVKQNKKADYNSLLKRRFGQMTSLQNKQSLSHFKNRYRISLGPTSNNKKIRFQNTQTLTKSFSSGYKKQRRSLQNPNSEIPEQMCSSAPFSTIQSTEQQPPTKLTSLSKFVRQGCKNTVTRQQITPYPAFKQVLEEQIQKDCNNFLQRISNKHNHNRSIINKRNLQNMDFDSYFLYERSNTF